MEKRDGQEYMNWKSWQDSEFGLLSSEDERRYEAEISPLDLPPAATVLEIGYGRGGFLSFAKRKQWNCIGIEVNPELLDIGTQAGFQVGDLSMYTELQKGSFDLVVAFDVLEHMTHQQIADLLQTLSAILKPGGSYWRASPMATPLLGCQIRMAIQRM